MGNCGENAYLCKNSKKRLMEFYGDYAAKTDAKGRVFLPAAFRRVLETEGCCQRFVLRADLFQQCLQLYPEELWKQRVRQLHAGMNPWNGNHQALLRSYMSGIEIVELDKSGRLLLTKRKMDAAAITDDVRFMGMLDHIEIWNNEVLDQHLNGMTTTGMDLQELMSDERIQSLTSAQTPSAPL